MCCVWWLPNGRPSFTCTAMSKRIYHSVWLLPWWRGVTGRSLSGFWQHIQSDIENFEGWLSPSGHSSGGRDTDRGFWFMWLLVFHSSLNIYSYSYTCISPFHHEHVCSIVLGIAYGSSLALTARCIFPSFNYCGCYEGGYCVHMYITLNFVYTHTRVLDYSLCSMYLS